MATPEVLAEVPADVPDVPAPVGLPDELLAELARLPGPPADPPPGSAAAPPLATLLDHSAAFVKHVARVGKQQMKTAQEVSLLSGEVHELLGALQGALRDKEEVIELLRRERDGLLTQSDALLRELLVVTDLFEHALRFAQRLGDRRWTEELERLDKGMMQALSRVGLREIPSLGLPLDPTLHEVVETLPRARLKKSPFPDANPHDIVEITQRGYFLGGQVLRRSRVITAAE